jgi:hypothetical protein
MWVLSILPDSLLSFFVNLVLIVGFLGVVVSSAFKYVVRYFPQIIPYRIALQVISVLLLSLGVYFKGGQVVEEKWRERVTELEAKLALAEIESQKENVKIVEKIVTKTQVIKERGEEIIRYVEVEVGKYNDKFAPGGVCEIPAEFIKAHNNSAEQPK